MEGSLIEVRDALSSLLPECGLAERVALVARRSVRDYGGDVLHVGPQARAVTEALKAASVRGRRKLIHVPGWDIHGDDAAKVLLRIRKGRYAFALFDGVDPLQPWLDAAMSGTDGIICVTRADEPATGAAIAGALAESWWWDAPLRPEGSSEAWFARGWPHVGGKAGRR